MVIQSGNGSIFVNPLVGAPVVFNIDPANGVLNGFCLRYFNLAADVRIFDGDTEIDSFTTVPGQFDSSEPETFICFENDGSNVTRIEIEPTPGQDMGLSRFFVDSGEFRFEEAVPDLVTCFELLSEFRANVAALLGNSVPHSHDEYLLENVLDCTDWMQQDVFWEQPSGNRLSQYGGTLFIGAAYTIAYLEHVEDPAADVLIDDLLDVLECLVDNEIAYAIANDGHTCFIERAEDFADLAAVIDDDFNNEVVASLAYRLAWLHAYYATQ